jgi:protein-tyrosine phosphatase
MTTLEHARHLALPGSYNVRDLGGYPSGSGRPTRWGVFFRADSLHRLQPRAQQHLRQHGLSTVIDLRRVEEVAAAPNVFAQDAGIRYMHISLFGTERASQATPGRLPRSLVEVYRWLLDERQDAFARVFQALAHEDGPALFHCTAGKDRTGMVAALLLDLAGVPLYVIAQDYALTGPLIQPLLPHLRATRPPGMTLEQYEVLLVAEPDDMAETLDYLYTRYGGAAGYLRTSGLPAHIITDLRDRLV